MHLRNSRFQNDFDTFLDLQIDINVVFGRYRLAQRLTKTQLDTLAAHSLLNDMNDDYLESVGSE